MPPKQRGSEVCAPEGPSAFREPLRATGQPLIPLEGLAMTNYLLLIREEGADRSATAHETKAAARSALASYVADNWHRHGGQRPLDDEEAVRAYFSRDSVDYWIAEVRGRRLRPRDRKSPLKPGEPS